MLVCLGWIAGMRRNEETKMGGGVRIRVGSLRMLNLVCVWMACGCCVVKVLVVADLLCPETSTKKESVPVPESRLVSQALHTPM